MPPLLGVKARSRGRDFAAASTTPKKTFPSSASMEQLRSSGGGEETAAPGSAPAPGRAPQGPPPGARHRPTLGPAPPPSSAPGPAPARPCGSHSEPSLQNFECPQFDDLVPSWSFRFGSLGLLFEPHTTPRPPWAPKPQEQDAHTPVNFR